MSTGWHAVSEPVAAATVTVSVRCDHCASAVAVNGPARRAHCERCLRATELTRLGEFLDAAIGNAIVVGSPYTVRTFDDQLGPTCRSCGGSVPLGEYRDRAGGVGTIPCPTCGHGVPTFPAPAWLKQQLPTAVQIFGADAEIAGEEAGLAVALGERRVQPIAMACPSCGGGLTFTEHSERSTACTYCGVSVFIPDALWLALHPAKTMERWTLTYRLNVPYQPVAGAAPSGAGATGAAPPPDAITLWVSRGGALVDQKTLHGRGTLKIGRNRTCDICVDHPTVSRLHAVVELKAGKLTVADLGSSSGTMVNGRVVSRASLEVGDVISVGDCRLEVGRPG
jgi:ribosomal protein S27AE